MATDVSSQKQEIKKMCGYQALPTFLTEVIIASNRPAAEISAMRCEAEDQKNEMVASLAKVVMLPRIENRYLTNGVIADGSVSG